MGRKVLLILGLIVLVIVAFATVTSLRKPRLPADLPGALEAATLHHGLPGMAACLVTLDDIETAAYGARALDASFSVHGRGALDPVSVADYWHLGSNSKAITATLAGILYEQGKLKAEDKLSSAFDFPLHADYRDVTLLDLLQHRSGLGPFTAGDEFDPYEDRVSSGTPLAQRLAFAKALLTEPAHGERGDYVYSNAGYGIAAAFIEARTGEAWEELLQRELFEPLAIRARIGWPATADDPNQPSGHWDEGDGLVPLATDHEYTLPSALDPAGDISMPIGDYGRFLQLHLRGMRGLMTEVGTGNGKRLLLLPATIELLHEPQGDYSCGWIETRTLGLQESTHDGSAGTFYCTATIDADSGYAVAVVTNAGNDAAAKAVHAVANRMIGVMIDKHVAAGK